MEKERIEGERGGCPQQEYGVSFSYLFLTTDLLSLFLFTLYLQHYHDATTTAKAMCVLWACVWRLRAVGPGLSAEAHGSVRGRCMQERGQEVLLSVLFVL